MFLRLINDYYLLIVKLSINKTIKNSKRNKIVYILSFNSKRTCNVFFIPT
jgi:hypothetical protein